MSAHKVYPETGREGERFGKSGTNRAGGSLPRDRARTGGDILIGVVGPVRTGKSTLIKQFMEKLVLPAIGSGGRKAPRPR